MSDEKNSNRRHGHKKHLNKKWLLINIGFAIVFILSLTIGYYFSTQNNKGTGSTVETKKIYKVSSDIQKLVNTGKTDDAVKAYDDAIAGNDDTNDKISLILSKASIYFNQNDYNTALTIAKQAQAVKETFAVTDYLAQVYEKLGNNTSAIKYYQKTIALMDKKGTTYSDDLKDYNAKITELSEEN